MGFLSSLLGNITQSLTGHDKANLGEVQNLGKEMLQKAAGEASVRLEQGVKNTTVNLENAYKRLAPINRDSYTAFQRNPKQYLEKEGVLWFVRKDLEAARYYCTGGKEGYGNEERLSGFGAAPFPKLKKDIEETEVRVKEMEKAKGYEFVSCIGNTIIFREITTGRELTPEESSQI